MEAGDFCHRKEVSYPALRFTTANGLLLSKFKMSQKCLQAKDLVCLTLNYAILLGRNSGCSDCEMVELRILRTGKKVKSKLPTLDFRRAGFFGCIKDPFGRVPWDKGLERRERQESRSRITSSKIKSSIPVNMKLGKNTRKPWWVNKMLLDECKHKKVAHRMWKQGTGSLGGIQRPYPSIQGS